MRSFLNFPELYLIEILHQTTTRLSACARASWLYLIEILHQTTTSRPCERLTTWLYLIEILHQTTTAELAEQLLERCILSKFYIKPQPCMQSFGHERCCILSKFYIKPQLSASHCLQVWVVSYRNSTSNHNFVGNVLIFVVLYLIEILHQTTTASIGRYLFRRCILSKFYIKPQLARIHSYSAIVVSYRNSTSNHNDTTFRTFPFELYLIEILHQTTT